MGPSVRVGANGARGRCHRVRVCTKPCILTSVPMPEIKAEHRGCGGPPRRWAESAAPEEREQLVGACPGRGLHPAFRSDPQLLATGSD